MGDIADGKHNSTPFGKCLQGKTRKKVGGYIIGKLLGEGAFAKVRLGIHVITNQLVAIKIINKTTLAKRDYLRRNLHREAAMLHRLRHANVIELYEVLETANAYYLVTEYVRGGHLVKYISSCKCLSENETRKYMRQIASAVDHMHRSNVVHRDLKMENLMLDENMNIKIIDFGLSNWFDGQHLLSTQCGSPAYTAPEVFHGKLYGPSVDVWSIGVNMFAMLTGRLPFVVEPRNNLTKLHAAILRGCTPPSYLSSDCKDMLLQLLEPSETRRISLTEILQHPWMNDGYKTLLISTGMKQKTTVETLNPAILQLASERLNVSKMDVCNAVIWDKLNKISATYRILSKKQSSGVPLNERDRKITNLTDNVSPTTPSKKVVIVVPDLQSPEITKNMFSRGCDKAISRDNIHPVSEEFDETGGRETEHLENDIVRDPQHDFSQKTETYHDYLILLKDRQRESTKIVLTAPKSADQVLCHQHGVRTAVGLPQLADTGFVRSKSMDVERSSTYRKKYDSRGRCVKFSMVSAKSGDLKNIPTDTRTYIGDFRKFKGKLRAAFSEQTSRLLQKYGSSKQCEDEKVMRRARTFLERSNVVSPCPPPPPPNSAKERTFRDYRFYTDGNAGIISIKHKSTEHNPVSDCTCHFYSRCSNGHSRLQLNSGYDIVQKHDAISRSRTKHAPFRVTRKLGSFPKGSLKDPENLQLEDTGPFFAVPNYNQNLRKRELTKMLVTL